MSELLPSGRSEGYGACDDEVDVGNDRKISDIGLFTHIQVTSVGKSSTLRQAVQPGVGGTQHLGHALAAPGICGGQGVG